MLEPITIAAALKSVGSELLEVAPWAWKHLPRNSPVRTAIRSAADRFLTRLPGFEQSLELWIVSDAFRAQVDAISAGALVDADACHAELFVQTTGYGLTGVSIDLVCEGLLFFYSELHLELCQGERGPRIIGATLQAIQHGMAELLQRRDTPHLGFLPYLPSIQADATSRAITVEDQRAEIELDSIKALINKRRGASALALLSNLQQRVDEGVLSTGLRVRYLLNKGVCRILAGDWDAAAHEFDCARTLDPANRKVLRNLAQVANFRKDFATGLQLAGAALGQDATDSNANGLRLICLHGLGRHGEVDEILKAQPSLTADRFCLYTLAYIAVDREQFDEAEQYLRRHNEIDVQSPEAWELLGRAIVIPTQRLLKDTAASLEWIPDAVRERLVDAHLCFSRAAEVLATSESLHDLKQVLANRGMTRSLLGRYDDARKDCERALQIDPSLEAVKCNLGRLHVIAGRPRESVAILESIESPPLRSEIAPILATAYLDLENPTAARQLLESLGPTASREDHLAILGLKLLAYDQLGDGDASRQVLTTLDAIPGNPDARRITAEHHFRKGNLNEAIRSLRLAIEESNASRAPRYHLVLADVLYRARRFADAVEEYEHVPVPACESDECMRYLISLFFAGRLSRALQLAQGVRRQRSAIANFSEIEALVYEQLGDLDRANQIRNELLSQSIAPAHQKLKIALNHFRKGRRSEAEALALDVKLTAAWEDSESLRDAAMLRALLGLPEALDFAYQLLQREQNDPDVHLFYIQTFLRREELDQKLFHPQGVAADCFVTLRHGNQLRSLTIVSGESDVGKDWLSTAHEFAAQMLGMRIGGTVRFPQEGPGSVDYRIDSIQSKFVVAFQDCLDRFTERFPSAYGLTRVEVRPDDPIEIVLMLEHRRAHTERILELYRQGRVPACTISRLLGKADAELFRTLSEDRREKVLISDGSPEKMQQEDWLVGAATAILLESSALVTLGSLNLLEVVASNFASVKITQRTVDSLRETLMNLFPERQTGVLYSDSPGHIVAISRTSDEVLQEQAFYQRLLDFAHSKSDIIAPSALEEFENPQALKVLGSVAVSSLAAAKGLQLLIISDDFALRVVAHSHAIPSATSLAVLKHLRRRSPLFEDGYHHAIQWLVDRGFTFVPVDKTDILSVLRKANWSPTAEVAVFLQTLAGPQCDTNAALRVVLDVLHEVWNEPLLPATSQFLSDLLLHVLTTGRNAGQVLHLLQIMNGHRSALWTPAQQIQNVIRSWGLRRGRLN